MPRCSTRSPRAEAPAEADPAVAGACVADHKRKSAWELTHNLDRLAAPVLSLEVGALFLVNYATSRVLERFAIPHAVVEIKECNAALIWLTLGLARLVRPPASEG